MSYRYHLLWQCEARPDGVEADDIPSGYGGCDAMIFLSLLFPPDGTYSMKAITRDGRTGDALEAGELWKAWFMLSKVLADRADLDPGRRELCQHVFDTICDVLMSNKAMS